MNLPIYDKSVLTACKHRFYQLGDTHDLPEFHWLKKCEDCSMYVKFYVHSGEIHVKRIAPRPELKPQIENYQDYLEV